jgi:hypothetical protein
VNFAVSSFLVSVKFCFSCGCVLFVSQFSRSEADWDRRYSSVSFCLIGNIFMAVGVLVGVCNRINLARTSSLQNRAQFAIKMQSVVLFVSGNKVLGLYSTDPAVRLWVGLVLFILWNGGGLGWGVAEIYLAERIPTKSIQLISQHILVPLLQGWKSSYVKDRISNSIKVKVKLSLCFN